MKSTKQESPSDTRRRVLSDESNWQDFVKTGQTEIKHDDENYGMEPMPHDGTIYDSPNAETQERPKLQLRQPSLSMSKKSETNKISMQISEPHVLDALGSCYGVRSPNSPRKFPMTKE